MPSLRAPANELITRTYQCLLNILDLDKAHHDALTSRGLTPKEIKANGYKTLPIRRREIAAKVRKAMGVDLEGVPGFWQNEQKEWELAGKSGLIIPVWNWHKEIEALKIRVDQPLDVNQKYILLSSRPTSKGQVRYPRGTASKIAVHFPLDRPKRLKVLRITEGELKADVATSLSGVYTVSLPGITMWRMALDVIREHVPEKVLIAFDSDKTRATNAEGQTDTSYVGGPRNEFASSISPEDFAVGKALANLYTSAREAFPDLPIFIEDWPADKGKGIDDVLLNGATDQLRELPEEDAREFVAEMLAGDTPQGWCYIIGTKRFIHTETNRELDKEQFSDHFAHEEKGVPSDKALRNPSFPKFDLPIYLPAAARTFRAQGHRYYNLWRPNETVQSAKGSIDPFKKHLAYLLPEESEQAIVLDWLAYTLQNPGEKIHWALLLQGKQGTGKSYLGWLMRLILGKHNVSMPTNDQIHEPYTDWQKSCQLIIIEELMARGRLDLMNKLKPMITQETTMIREMYKPSYEQPNVFNFLMFTNHEDAIIIDESDRRYGVFFSPAEPQPHAYYDQIFSWSRDNLGAILYFLLQRDLSAFVPKGHAPMTTGKRELISMSLTPLEAWMKEGIELENWPFMADLVGSSHLLECLPGHLGNVSLQALGRTLKALGARQLQQVKLSTGASVRPWSLRRHEVWASAERSTVAAEYEKWGGRVTPGGEDQYNPVKAGKPL